MQLIQEFKLFNVLEKRVEFKIILNNNESSYQTVNTETEYNFINDVLKDYKQRNPEISNY